MGNSQPIKSSIGRYEPQFLNIRDHYSGLSDKLESFDKFLKNVESGLETLTYHKQRTEKLYDDRINIHEVFATREGTLVFIKRRLVGIGDNNNAEKEWINTDVYKWNMKGNKKNFVTIVKTFTKYYSSSSNKAAIVMNIVDRLDLAPESVSSE